MRVIISIIFIIVISGCTDSNDLMNNRNKYIKWFDENHGELKKIVDEIYLHPCFEHIGVVSIEYMSNHEKFTKSDYESYNSILDKRDDLGISNIDIFREEQHLFIISFTVLSEGFVFSDGYSLSIAYMPDEKYLKRVKSRAKEYNRKYYNLDRPNWYLIEYNSRK